MLRLVAQATARTRWLEVLASGWFIAVIVLRAYGRGAPPPSGLTLGLEPPIFVQPDFSASELMAEG